jgi:hypothetical protein
VSALREAEALAGLTSSVSGPADEPYRDEKDEPGWVEDWAKRAGETLEKARQWASQKPAALRERARRIMKHVRDGAEEIRKATLGRAAKTLESVTSTAQTIQFGAAGVSVLLTVGLAWLAYRIYMKG